MNTNVIFGETLTEIQFSSILYDTIECPDHIHNLLEIVMVSEGTMHMTLDGQDIYLEAGSAIFIEPFEIHSFIKDKPNKAYIIEFMLENNLTFWEFLQKHMIVDRKIVISPATFDYLKAKLPKNTTRNANLRYDSLFLETLLVPLCYEFIAQCKTTVRKNKNDDIYISCLKLLTTMIWETPEQEISLKIIAKKLGIHETTLSRTFAKQTKMSFTESVQYLRVCKASYLLRKNMQISVVADFSGFQSIRSFNRVFKKITGCTPTEYVHSLDDSSIQ